MSVEGAVVRRSEEHGLGAIRVDHDGEAAGAAGEQHSAAAHWIGCGVMAAGRDRHRGERGASFIDQQRGEGTVGIHRACDEELALVGGKQRARERRRGKPRHAKFQQGAAINRHRVH